MDDSRVERRRSIKSLLFGKFSFGRRFERSTVNYFREGNEEAEAGFRKCSSHRSHGAASRDTSSQGSSVKKSSLARSFSWVKWNFLSSLRNKYNPSHPPPFKISCSSLANRKHEISSSCGKIKPCVESGMKIIQQQQLGIAFLAKKFDEMTVKESVEAELCRRPPVNCYSPAAADEDGTIAEHCKDDKEHADLCQEEGSDNENEEADMRSSCHKQSGEDGDVEERFSEQGGLQRCPTEDHVWHRKKELRRFPPPLPSLARTGNLPCHMPWVHLRSYKRDGRLVIQEVKVQHHEFFRAERNNGRLILQLVQHDEGKIRAHQAEKFKAGLHKISVDQSGQDSIDQTEEMDTEEVLDEATDVLQNDNGGKDNVVAEEKLQKIDVDVEGLDKFTPNFIKQERELQVPIQQRFSPLGLESPAGCCSPTPNCLFEIPITAIRPIRS